MSLNDLREATEALAFDLARRRLAVTSGQSAAFELSDAFRAQPSTGTLDALGLVREAQAAARDRRATRLGHLAEYLWGVVEARAAGSELPRLQALRGTVTGLEAGERLTVATALVRLPAVAMRDSRQALEANTLEHLSRADGAIARGLEAIDELAVRAGFASAHAARGTLAGLDWQAVAADAEAFLAATEAMYDDVLTWWMRRTVGVKLHPHGAERHDVLHALALLPLDGLFPRGDLTLAVAGAFTEMGLDPLAEGRIRVDATDLAHKLPEPFVARLRVPDDLVVHYRPQGGHRDVRALLNGLGRALFRANVDANRPFEDRLLGDPAVDAGFGLLFETLLVDRRWLKRVLDAELPDLQRILGLAELFRRRLDAARLLHAHDVGREGVTAGLAERYSDRMTKATRARWPGRLCLWDLDAAFTALREAHAPALQAGLLDALHQRFDVDWWRNPEAGPWLVELFAQGGLESAPVLAQRLALGPLTLLRTVPGLNALLS